VGGLMLLISLRVVYERGPPDEYQVNNRIRAATARSARRAPLDTAGRPRLLFDPKLQGKLQGMRRRTLATSEIRQ
jgi:hypothetical protein